jgi:hypothetical protein
MGQTVEYSYDESPRMYIGEEYPPQRGRGVCRPIYMVFMLPDAWDAIAAEQWVLADKGVSRNFDAVPDYLKRIGADCSEFDRASLWAVVVVNGFGFWNGDRIVPKWTLLDARGKSMWGGDPDCLYIPCYTGLNDAIARYFTDNHAAAVSALNHNPGQTVEETARRDAEYREAASHRYRTTPKAGDYVSPVTTTTDADAAGSTPAELGGEG